MHFLATYCLMLIYLLPVHALVAVISGLQIYPSSCSSGWFGESCMFRCHCINAMSCLENGECFSNGRCSADYFGPACQFREALKWRGSSAKSYLTDRDDTTCNPDDTAQSVEVTLNSAIVLTWFRLRVNNNKYLLNFTTKVDVNSGCANEIKFQVDNNTVDVTCDGGVSMHNLSIIGPVAPSICSLSLSGGRNTALKQPTRQTSSYIYGTSDKAVDGSTNSDFYAKSCTHTGLQDPAPRWRLNYNRPHHIYAIYIYSRSDLAFRLDLSTVLTFDVNAKLITSFINKKTGWAILSIGPIYSNALSAIEIRVSTAIAQNDRILTMCEVQTWGDNACPSQKYGIFCANCTCGPMEVCNVYTGTCARICRDGFFGPNCTAQCSRTCSGLTCDPSDGVCFDCLPGYTGTFCTERCPNNTYGLKCENCTCKPLESCHYYTGACSRICSHGFFGLNCSSRCSQTCSGKDCDPSDGNCFSCLPGYQGATCIQASTCPIGTYGKPCKACSCTSLERCDVITGACSRICPNGLFGPKCSFRCSPTCSGKTCDPRSGSCLDCLPGYQGRFCTKGCYRGYYGYQCKFSCPYRCSLNCAKENGSCLYCTEGFFEKDCTGRCPQFCDHRRCDRFSGECIGCFGRRMGNHCQDCNFGRYGLLCEFSCPWVCFNSTCDSLTGRCPNCRDGYSGDLCLTVPEKPKFWIAPFSLIPFALLVFFCVPTFDNGESDEEYEPDPNQYV